MAASKVTAYLLHHPVDRVAADGTRAGLERFSRPRPWTRAVHVEEDLSQVLAAGTPSADHTAASHDTTPKLVLLTSDTAAASSEFNDQLARWIDRHGADSVLPVVLGTGWAWDEPKRDFRWSVPATVACVPPILRGAYGNEPRHIELKPDADAEWYRLRNPAFRDKVADIAATVRGVSKDQLEDDDRRQQRRRTRLAAVGAGALACLLVVSTVLGLAAQRGRRAADEERVAAEAATDEAIEQTRAATAARLSAQVLADEPASDRIRGLLAVTAYELDPTSISTAALARSLGEREGHDEAPYNGFERFSNGILEVYEPVDLAQGTALPFLDGEGAAYYPPRDAEFGPFNMLRTTTADGPIESIELRGLREVLAAGGGGRWLLATRDPVSGDTPMLFDYEGASALPPLLYRNLPDVIRPGAGPQSCQVLDRDPCREPVIVDTESWTVTPVRTELGVDAARSNPDDRSWPDPVSQYHFTGDGAHLLSLDPVADQLVVTNVATGTSRTVGPAEYTPLSDFGLIDNELAWHLYGSALTIFQIATADVVAIHELGGLGTPTAVDVDVERGHALVGLAPSTYSLVDLEGLRVKASVTTAEAEEVLLGPNGRWAAIGGGGMAYLVDVDTLTTVVAEGTLFFNAAAGLDEAEFSFDPTGTRLLMRPVNPAFPTIYVMYLDPERWVDEVCQKAGTGLTESEWDRYVGLDGRFDVCQTRSLPAAPSISETEDSEDDRVPNEDETTAASTESAEGTAETDSTEDGGEFADEPATSDLPTGNGAIQLRTDGLGVVSFSVDEATAVEAISAELGEPLSRFLCDVSPESPCGPHDPQGASIAWARLSIWIDAQSGTFASYTVFDDGLDQPVALATPEGLQLGLAAADVLAAYPAGETWAGCQDYETLYEQVHPGMTDGQLRDPGTRYTFTFTDGAVVAIGAANEAMFEFWGLLFCSP